MRRKKILTGILLGLAIQVSAQVAPYKITALTGASTGYYFLMPSLIFPGPMIPRTQMILDHKGELVYYRPFIVSSTPGFTVQPNGLISYFHGNQYTILDSTFTHVDTVRCVGYTTDSHELQYLPNGNRLVLGIEVDTVDLSMYNMFNHNGTPGSPNAQLKSNIIQEIDSAGNVVFEWHTRDHFAFDDVDENWLGSPSVVDWSHCNTLELDTDGNILLSSRHFNEITKINRSDSSIMWRMGGKKNEFTFINDSVPFYGQHDIRRQLNGNVTLYDNGWNSSYGPVHPARALEYTLDETAKTATLVWSYVYDSSLYSRATGNMQRLPNGNTLINYGFIDSLHNVTFVVVDSSGSKVFEIAFDDTCYSYRSFNFQSLPWSFHRPEVTCIDSAGTPYLIAEPGHQNYYWSNGATTQAIPVTGPDTCYVIVPYGTSGYITSERFYIDSTSDPCGLYTETEEAGLSEDIQFFPNPASETVYLKTNLKISGVEIYDLQGRRWAGPKMEDHELRVKNLPPGLYLLKVISGDTFVIKKFLRN